MLEVLSKSGSLIYFGPAKQSRPIWSDPFQPLWPQVGRNDDEYWMVSSSLHPSRVHCIEIITRILQMYLQHYLHKQRQDLQHRALKTSDPPEDHNLAEWSLDAPLLVGAMGFLRGQGISPLFLVH